jgi:acetyl-CoA C-acetyltransferase/acetyl-CoA acyltransferase 2
MSTSLVFLSGKRTPFGSNGGSLKDAHPTDLGLSSAKAALLQSKVSPADIDHVIFGNLLYSQGDTIYIPRHIGLRAGVPDSVPALGINRLCGTGFQVIVETYQQMLAGDTKIALVGGVENMSMAPYMLSSVRFGAKMGNQKLTDVLMEGLYDTYAQAPMAITAENLSEKYKIPREECDRFALSSQKKYAAALAAGKFSDEIAPYAVQDRKGNTVNMDKDEHPRPESTPEVLAKLKPVFKKDGVVTAGNASGIVDGAASLVVATEAEARARKLEPLGRLIAYGVAGCDPKIMGIGPAPAARIALKKASMTLQQMDLIEVNEAFAAQTLAVGHPLAASGARITLSALYELRRRKKRLALVSACIGGGQGIALVIEAF